jgi:primosomal protein N' (replication factor Y)
MPEFCDVALPVPLDMAFTYRVPADAAPMVGGRVLVPFRQQRMTGIVVELHDRKPSVQIKNLITVIDAVPVLDEQLLHLGRWIADYYLSPIGEVLRTMLPLGAEFKRFIGYRIADAGQMALHQAGTARDRRRARNARPEEQAAEFRVLDYLAARASESTIRLKNWFALRPCARQLALRNLRARAEWCARSGSYARRFVRCSAMPPAPSRSRS